MISSDAALCMRVPSSRPKTFADGSTAYIHPLDGAPVRYVKPEKPRAYLNVTRKMDEFQSITSEENLESFADSIGVSVVALNYLRCVKAKYQTWAFPMRDGSNCIIGFRLRSEDGRKWAESGSQSGIFLPQCEPQKTCILCEGPTDSAAALTIGMFPIGRPSSNGGVLMVKDAIKRLGIQRAIIVADCDKDKKRPVTGEQWNPGIDGAMALSEHIGIPSCTLVLPCKDLRQFVNHGGDQATLMALVATLVWRR